MNLHLEHREEGQFAFFIDGDLQFDTADEAIYHESLALPALCLAAQKAPPEGMNVLICGGGDGLALRECLRFPGVIHVDLVDYSEDVIALGRTRFALQNRHAFVDPRVQVHIADAWDFLEAPPTHAAYDVILCDFTVPHNLEEALVFTQEWYALVQRALTTRGVAGINAASPEVTPEAFWCLNKTVRAAKLKTLPYRACIPSFRTQGYGAWGFLLAAHYPLTIQDLHRLKCPVTTEQTALAQLAQGAQFSRAARRIQQQVPIHTRGNGCLPAMLLNPGNAHSGSSQNVEMAVSSGLSAPYDLERLLHAIPITHPYHTRAMIEALAEQVTGTVRRLDLQRLIEALLARAKSLPADLLFELTHLRTHLQNRLQSFDAYGKWGQKLFVTLVILMTLANSVAPDNAFAKGASGIGHSSMSRGYSGSFGSGSGGFSSGGRATTGSFGRGAPGFGSSFGSSGRTATGSFGSAPAIRSSGFRSSYGRSGPTDLYGVTYTPRTYSYYHSYGRGGYYSNQNNNGMAPDTSQETHTAYFVADDDLLVLDNGDVVVTLSDTAYLLLGENSLALMSNKTPAPLFALYPDPTLFQNVVGQLQDQQGQVEQAIRVRRDWLAWMGWTSALSPVIAGDKAELHNLEDLAKRLQTALTRIKIPAATTQPTAAPEANAVELFADSILLQNGQVALRNAQNAWTLTDGKQFLPVVGHTQTAFSPELRAALKSVLQKLEKEFAGDLASAENDLKQLTDEQASLQKDLAEYQKLYQDNGSQSDYQVDYGTEEIGVSDAISRTQRDLEENARNTTTAKEERDKTAREQERVQIALSQFAK